MEDLEGALSLLTGDLIGALSLLKGDLTLKNDFHNKPIYSTMSFLVVLKQPRKIILQLVVLKKTEDQLS